MEDEMIGSESKALIRNRILKVGAGRCRKGHILLSAILFIGSMLLVAEVRSEVKPSLAILPFFVERLEDPARGAVKCPLCKGIFRNGKIVPGSENTLTKLLYRKLDAAGTFNTSPLKRVEEALSPVVKKRFEEKPIPSAIHIGRELDADFVLVGYLFRFEERIGSSIGVEKPASVGFDLHLIRIRDGKGVWNGKFNETQKALSEDLLKMGSFFRRKASWLTAEELASVGLDEVLRGLPGSEGLEKE
jgi:hypothetical protein